MIHAIVADDELLARQKLRQLLREEPEVDVVGESSTAAETIELVRMTQPDLLFLDIRMPGMDGFDVISALSAQPSVPMPRIIFTTAYDTYALRAFEIHAVDYLLKPVEPARLQQALQRARERLREPRTDPAARSAQVALSARPPGQWLDRLVIREGTRVHVLGIHTVDFIEAQDDYLVIAAAGKRYRKQQTLAQLEAQLDPKRFVRVHRSFVLNVERIARIEPYAKDSWQIFLSEGSHLPMSRSGYQRLRAVLD